MGGASWHRCAGRDGAGLPWLHDDADALGRRHRRGISSAIARALGGGRRGDADALVLHALVINGAFGLGFTALVLWFGPALYAALGGEGGSLRAALAYSDIVFGGAIMIWLSNAFASVLRGTGNMMLPSISIIIGVVVLVPLSPLLIYGLGPVPAMGIAGAGWAVVAGMALSTVILAWAVISGRSIARLRWARLRWALFRDILAVGAVASVSTLQTTLTIALTTAVVARAGGPDAVAGYGTGTRLEYLLVPLVFGLGAPLVALVGTNIGAGQGARALRIALTGGALAFVVTETIGLVAAIWPEAWLGLFGADPRMLETGAAYLRVVGPTYGFFGLGLSLYFASQGAGRLGWPLFGGLLRLVIAVGGGWVALHMTGSLAWVFAALAAGLVVYGVVLAVVTSSGAWFRQAPEPEGLAIAK
ncbi:MATE family efflux transporter [Paeniroseomonas aquatica]|uniref:MATE family efflux transporter n=1 Tax=Paeniroseomonas aquatica TaxID=373043 RepID=UPI00361AEE34